jgi:hypothetical protein
MSKLNEIESLGLKITWSLIFLGLYGHGQMEPQISKDDVVNYSCAIISADSQFNEEIVLLTWNSISDYEMKNILTKLMQKEHLDIQLEFRKWRALIVNQTILSFVKNKIDYLNGLIELTELWASFGYPDDSPHVIQGRNNDLTPQEYYSKKMFDSSLQEHQRWVEKEIKFLKEIDRQTA